MPVTPKWHLCRWPCLCQMDTLTRTQQVDVGTSKHGSVCLLEEQFFGKERLSDLSLCVALGQLLLKAAQVTVMGQISVSFNPWLWKILKTVY